MNANISSITRVTNRTVQSKLLKELLTVRDRAVNLQPQQILRLLWHGTASAAGEKNPLTIATSEIGIDSRQNNLMGQPAAGNGIRFVN
jgi:hypothetical protein